MDINIKIEHVEIRDNNEMQFWEERYPQMLLVPVDIDVEPVVLPEVCPFCGFKKTNENQVETRQQTRMKSRHESCPVIRD